MLTYHDIEHAKRSVSLSRVDLMAALDEYLDLWSRSDREYCDRIRKRINDGFNDEVRAFSAVRDAIVLQAMRMIVDSNNAQVIDEYLMKLASEEPDDDLRRLRLGLAGWGAC